MKLSQKKFSKLYDKLLKKVYRFVFLKTGSRETAEDLTAQAFVNVWRKAKSGLDIENPSAYIFQTARAEVANYYRGKNRLQIISTDSAGLSDLFAGDSFLEKKAQTADDFQAALLNLSCLGEESQTVLILRYVNGFSVKKTAVIMEKSEGAVRVMAHRALQELRKRIL